jgi:uncharacterized protein (DUF1501 family)
VTTRRGLLGGALATTALALAARRASAAEERHLLVYWVKGGWDPTFCFDPHFDSPSVEGDPDAAAATANGIAFADADDRPSVRAFFERWGSSAAVVNGLSVGSISHEVGTRLVLTGRRDLLGADLPTRIAGACGGSLAVPHAVVSGPSVPGSLGGLVTRFDETLLRAARGEGPVPRDDSRDARVRAWLGEEVEASEDPAVRGWGEAAERLPALRGFAADFNGGLVSEADRVRLVAALFASGVSRSAILTGSVPQMAQWDSHVQNRDWQSRCYDLCFSNIDGLCSMLAATPASAGGSVLDRTVLLVVSEMGRQPTLNAQGGKDHWPTTSAMLFGAGVAGGRVYGGTTAGLVARGIDRATGEADDAAPPFGPDDLAATLALAFDVDPASIAPEGEPLTAIWS